MRLYLCSYRLPNPKELFKLVGKSPDKISVAVIPHAKDYYAERARRFKINETEKYLTGFGLKPTTVDLRDFSSAEEIKKSLKDYDLIWVSGGNTFCLRYQMKRSGFESIIKDLLKNDEVVYVGESAGACIIGNTLKGHEAADEPAFAEEIIWEGLNVLPKFILPHTDNPMFATDIEAARRQHENSSEVIELTDSQALIINGSQQKIVEKPA